MQRDYRPFLDAGSSASKTELALQLYAENSPLVPITIPYGKVYPPHRLRGSCTIRQSLFPCSPICRILGKRTRNLCLFTYPEIYVNLGVATIER